MYTAVESQKLIDDIIRVVYSERYGGQESGESIYYAKNVMETFSRNSEGASEV